MSAVNVQITNLMDMFSKIECFECWVLSKSPQPSFNHKLRIELRIQLRLQRQMLRQLRLQLQRRRRVTW